MTREQTIVLGFLAAAFVAGWVVHALTGRRDGRPAEPAGAPAPPDDARLRRAIEASRQQLDVAVRSYLTAIAASLGDGEPARPEPGDLPTEAAATEAGDLADDVSAALSDDEANRSMLSAVGADSGTRLSERELDLADWGFAYGVAWARAREREPAEGREAVAQAALRAADPVFRAYAAEADWDPASSGNGQPQP
jgi:hypothetical protein